MARHWPPHNLFVKVVRSETRTIILHLLPAGHEVTKRSVRLPHGTTIRSRGEMTLLALIVVQTTVNRHHANVARRALRILVLHLHPGIIINGPHLLLRGNSELNGHVRCDLSGALRRHIGIHVARFHLVLDKVAYR